METTTSSTSTTVRIGDAIILDAKSSVDNTKRDWTKSQYAEVFQLILDMDMDTKIPVAGPGVTAKTYRNRLTAADNKFGIRKGFRKGIKVQFKLDPTNENILWLEKRRG